MATAYCTGYEEEFEEGENGRYVAYSGTDQLRPAAQRPVWRRAVRKAGAVMGAVFS
ncbi:hypothetical protein [Hymenobacter terrenus]|uniref:hypothetical protein n=1 Tax=Hymenobacter terrenus TaxID=1629124 RepID=UPI000AD1BC78|nr:hypothetical protein [Hymenobacter terrenus]